VDRFAIEQLGGRLAGLPVTIEGGASTPYWGDAARTSAWRGVAHSTERVVAIAFMTTARGTSWLKSRRSWGNAVFVEIGRSGDSESAHLLLTLGSWVWPDVREGTFEELSARWTGTVPVDGEIQVPLLKWGWGHCASVPVWGCDDPATSVPRRLDGETGQIVSLLSVPAASISVDLLVLPRREIRGRRLQIWGLKRRCRDDVPEPLRHVLSFGRSGVWPPDRRKGQKYGP
jgi:hypothetical protein